MFHPEGICWFPDIPVTYSLSLHGKNVKVWPLEGVLCKVDGDGSSASKVGGEGAVDVSARLSLTTAWRHTDETVHPGSGI